MKNLLHKLLSPTVLGVLALLALSVLLWWVGPLVSIAEVRPLEGMVARLAVLLLLWGLFLGVLAWKTWQRRRTNRALLSGMASGPSAADKEAQALSQRFAEAIAKLEGAGPRGPAKWLGGGSFLYELPWYMFIGAPGSGKTTALANADLQFLLGDAGRSPLAGVGGTRNCEWWFTQDAVLIDTAGRYATQDSDRDVDGSAWDAFLTLLKKTRPRQPINGVLLTVSVQDLLQQGSRERAEHAGALRQRLAELQAKLGVRVPVYVLITKADLIGGFAETFESMGAEERAQVWGCTFPVELPAQAPLQGLDERLSALRQRLVEQMPTRLNAERDAVRRTAIFAFAQEFAALCAALNPFLRAVFEGGGALEQAPWVRGVYFASGTQEGSPIDRVMGAIGRGLGLPAGAAVASGARGKSYFLHRLLKDLVFTERGLGVLDLAAEHRRRARRTAVAGAIAVLAAVVLVGWFVSRARNLNHAEQVLERVPALSQAVQAMPPLSSADLAPLVPVLSQVRDVARLEAFAIGDPALLHSLGLYQGDKLDAAAQQTYARLLQKTLMPRIAKRLEERLRAASRDNLENAYEALKAYLMLHDAQLFDPVGLRAWIRVDWDAQYGRFAPDQRAQLDAHLDALLAQGAPQAVAARDAALVSQVRDMLVAFPLEYRVWSRIQRSWRPQESPEFSVSVGAGPNAAAVFVRASGEPLTQGISGLYTKAGWEKYVKPAVPKTALQLAREESTVLGLKTDVQRMQALAAGTVLADKIKRLYFQAYIKAWDTYLADVRLVKLDSVERSLAVSRLLAAPDSPLATWLRAVTEQTRLVPPANSAAGALDKLAGQAQAQAAALAGAGASEGPVERMVDDHFAAIHRQVSGQPAPIEETLKLFGEIYGQLAAVEQAAKTGLPPPPAGGGGAVKIKSVAGTLPPQVGGMLMALADATANQGRSAELQSLSADLKPIAEFCARAIAGRYPFASGAKADVLTEDFGQFFGAGGLMDEFFRNKLQALVDTSRPAWAYRAVDASASRPVAAAALLEFQRAQRIREVFFRAGGKVPALRLELRLLEIDPALKELVLDVDGQIQRLTMGGPSVALSWPSARLASQVRLFTGLGEQGPQLLYEGPWGLFRLIDRFEVQPSSVPERLGVVMNLEGKRARLDVISASVFNPFQLREIKQFRCPSAL